MEACSKRKVVNICVFCGSNPGNKPEFVEAAAELGATIAKRKLHLVYGGGNLGLMGAVSRAALCEGSQVLGIIPKALANDNLVGATNGEELIVSGMTERITEMMKHADAFIALPGGLGTMEELFTVTSRGFLSIHQKPVGLLNVDNFFDFLCIFIEESKKFGFTTKSAREMFLIAKTPGELLDKIEAFEPTVDPVFSKLDWSEDDRSKKRKVTMDLNLKLP